MAEEPKNLDLNPYGVDGYSVYAASVGSDEAALLARAKMKLTAVRSGDSRDRRVGVRKRVAAWGLFIIALQVFSVVWLGGWVLADPFSQVSLMRWGSTGMQVGFGVWMIIMTMPITPKLALYRFYNAVGIQDCTIGMAMVVASDLDELERTVPSLLGMEDTRKQPHRFSVIEQFRLYWMKVANVGKKKRRMVKIKKMRVEKLAPDLILCRAEVGFRNGNHNFRRAKTMHQVQKLLVKVGHQWKLFNGEWQGYDETNLSWLA
ncbi:MAG: hypothetical protein L3J82_05905 [Planctomycetes bacterium]|nr:hypothetical protein [Planctomycetota bacterium]